MDLVGVPSTELDRVWLSVKDRIADTLERFSDDEVTADDIHVLLRNRDAQLWTTTEMDAVWVTQILNKHAHREMLVWLFNADELVERHWEMFDRIHEWAKEQGCTKSRVIVRPGFERDLKKHGWTKRHVTLTREI